VSVFGPPGFVDACGITLRWRLEADRPSFEPHELRDGFHTEVSGADVTALRVQHGDLETYGLRISADRLAFAYSADATRSDALVRLARDADLFLCEAGTLDESSTMHLNPAQAGAVAAEAGARCLVLTHLSPGDDERRFEELARTTFGGRLVIARDGLSVELSGRPRGST
jgi:ribonuclease BN (tRNA processing enzyme)